MRGPCNVDLFTEVGLQPLSEVIHPDSVTVCLLEDEKVVPCLEPLARQQEVLVLFDAIGPEECVAVPAQPA